MKYMGSKNRIAKHILPIMLAEATHKAVEKLFKVQVLRAVQGSIMTINNQERKAMQRNVEDCSTCGKGLELEDEIKECNYGVFCSDECHAKYVLDDETYKEIYGE